MQSTAICKGVPAYLSGGLYQPKQFSAAFPAGTESQRAFTKKVFRVMKLTAFILLVFCLQVSANVSSQTITYTGKNVSLDQVFTVIKQQTGYTVAANAKLIKTSRPVSIEANQVPLEPFLEKLLHSQSLQFVIRNKTIIVSRKVVEKKEEQPNKEISNEAAKPPVTGVVKDSTGTPLVGASVKVKGTNKGTSTNAKGEFMIDANLGDILIVSFVGFYDQEFRINNDAIIIVMKRSESALNEVQIIAYGQTTKRLQTGNVSTVKAAELEKQPINNPLLGLAGRIPGIFVEQATGFAGTGVKVRVQGQNSIGSGNDPLYVVDGVPYSSQLLSTNVSVILGNSNGANGNPLSFINTADIESIDILKDADATSIYGSRAANGAVLITTKKGKVGRTMVNLNAQSGWGEVSRKLKLLSTEQYLEIRHEALKNAGLTSPGAFDYDLNGLVDTTHYTDWQKELIGGTAEYNDIQASVSGGNNNTQFLIGAGYHLETTVFPGDFADQRGSVHFNINNRSADKRFHIQLTGNYLYDDNKLPGSDLTLAAVTLAPLVPSLYNTDGSLNWIPDQSGSSTIIPNPLSHTRINYQGITNNLIGNLELGYQLLKGFDIKTTFGYNNLRGDEFYAIPLSSQSPESQAFGYREARYTDNQITTYSIEPQLNYKKKYGNHSLEGLVGSTILKTQSDGQFLTGSGFNSDEVIKNLSAATSIYATTYTSTYKYAALFARLTYNYKQRYIVNLSGRRDGSSRFGSENQFHNFGAIGGAWIISEENFMRSLNKILSFAKLRGSYGTTGNDQIGDYSYLSLYNPIYIYGTPYQGISAIEPSRLTNPYLQWEETSKFQLGLDLVFFKDRINLSGTYYDNRSSNQLLPYSLPQITGFLSIASNFPATVKNYGWEITLNTHNLRGKNFTWSSSFNITIPKSKLIQFDNLENSSYANSLRIGMPINVAVTFPYAGIDPQTGLYQFWDSEGKLTSNPISPKDNLKFIKLDPSYYGGLSNSFSFKNLQLDILLQFVKQIGKNYALGSYRPGFFNGWSGNQPAQVMDRWQQPGDDKSYQRVFPTNSNVRNAYSYARNQSDFVYGTASFVKLKNVSLSYLLPSAWMQKAHIQNAKIFIQGQNLLTFTDYFGLDPESKSSTTLPPLRVITLGVNLTF